MKALTWCLILGDMREANQERRLKGGRVGKRENDIEDL